MFSQFTAVSDIKPNFFISWFWGNLDFLRKKFYNINCYCIRFLFRLWQRRTSEFASLFTLLIMLFFPIQCDRMARWLFFQHLAIHNNENLPNSVNILIMMVVWNFVKYYEKAQKFQRRLKFCKEETCCQICSHCYHLEIYLVFYSQSVWPDS